MWMQYHTCCAHEYWLLGGLSLQLPEDAGGPLPDDGEEDRPDDLEPAGMEPPLLGMQ